MWLKDDKHSNMQQHGMRSEHQDDVSRANPYSLSEMIGDSEVHERSACGQCMKAKNEGPIRQ